MATKEEIKNRLEVLEAYWSGEVVQWTNRNTDGGWLDCGANEIFNWSGYNFRVKPKLREVWVLFDEERKEYSSEPYLSLQAAKDSKEDDEGIVKFREVMEDE